MFSGDLGMNEQLLRTTNQLGKLEWRIEQLNEYLAGPFEERMVRMQSRVNELYARVQYRDSKWGGELGELQNTLNSLQACSCCCRAAAVLLPRCYNYRYCTARSHRTLLDDHAARSLRRLFVVQHACILFHYAPSMPLICTLSTRDDEDTARPFTSVVLRPSDASES
jgi:hypothetical protein